MIIFCCYHASRDHASWLVVVTEDKRQEEEKNKQYDYLLDFLEEGRGGGVLFLYSYC